MSIPLQFVNNNIQVYAYESFDFTISNVAPLGTLQPVSNSGGLNPTDFYFTKNGNTSVRFNVSGTLNNLTPGTTETFTLTADLSGGIRRTSSNTVSIGGGRLLDANGNSLSNTTYTFYKNEPISQTLGRPLRLVAPSFALKTPTSVPSLPPGLTFVRVDSNIFDISGIPLVTVPNSNYQIIGIQSNGSKIATTRINLSVGGERLQVNLSGSSIIGGMQIGVPITPRVLTAIPPLGQSNVRYTFPSLPDGIIVTDVLGNPKTSPFFPVFDPSFTMIITGTPTLAAAVAFKNAGITAAGSNITVRASLGLLVNDQPFTFSFRETVLFDTPVLSSNYVGVPVDPSSNFFRAETYFTSNVAIADISASSLPAGVLLNFLPGTGTATLSGTPSSTGSTSYTIIATNSNGISGEITPTITISNDAVSFSSPVGVDLCYNFILSRPLTQFKTGYYTSNVQFTATAASRRAVSLSAPALIGTGLSLDSNGLLVGIPSTITPLTDLNVTATVAGSPATATRTVKFAIIDDVFTFTDVASSNFNFIQNIASTPFQIPVTTLSDRNVINYSQSGFPTGLTISPSGVVSGTPSATSPTSGTVTITASTGYTSGSRDFSYNLIPDSMLFIVSPTQYNYIAGDPVGNIDVDAVTYSGITVSNYDLSISPTYGLAVNSSTGVLSGTWTNGLPPNTLLPSSCNFAMTARAGTLTGVLPMSFTANPIVSNAMLFVAYGNPTGESDLNSWLYSTSPANITSFSRISAGTTTLAYSDIQIKNNDPTSNVIIALTTGLGDESRLYRGTRLDNIQEVTLDPTVQYYPNLSAVANKTGTSTWFAAGIIDLILEGGRQAGIVKSIDDGLNWDFPSATSISSGGQELYARDLGITGYAKKYDPYLRNAVAMRYSSSVLMVGGALNIDSPVMLRSIDDGVTWNTVTGAFAQECSAYSLENPTIWLATGSSGYKTIDFTNTTPDYTGVTDTIKYSFDQGQTWLNASNGFGMFGYELIYANGTWMASGTNAIPSEDVPGETYFVPEVRYSTNGVNWIKADFTEPLFNQSNTIVSNALAPLRVGSMNFDGTFWNVFVNEELPEDGRVRLYRHDAVSDLDTDWFAVDISGSTTNQPVLNSNTRMLSLTPPKYLFTGEQPINIQLNITANGVGGPVFTSPLSSSFLQYQYMRIAPIQLSATGTGQVYFFVETATLPAGLSYNRITNQITGTSVQLGQVSTTVYAKDDVGTSSFTLSFTTVVPRIIRKQDGAGAYTSLLRQYTEVLGAQNARDNRVLPNQERALGEFMSPEAPDVITQTIDPKCRNPNC
jgi:hypothetical protein